MKKRAVSIFMAAVLCAAMLTGCGGSSEDAPAEADTGSKTEEAADAGQEAVQDEASGDKEVLEFYHGYYQDESEWAAAQAMRDIYDAFAEAHADGNVEFKPIAVENRDEIVSAQVAGGNFPDIVDLGDAGASLSAIQQGLIYDLKPYIDENGLQDAVGVNYTQHDVDGHIYLVHDQIESRRLWCRIISERI